MTSTSLALDSPAEQLQHSARRPQVPRSATFVEFARAEIEQSISARFEKQVAHYPDRVALKTRDGTLTYAQLNQRANRVAHALLQRRELLEEPIAFLLGQSERQIATILGILKAGKIYVPLDPSLPTARLASILEDSGASVVVTDELHQAVVEELSGNAANFLTLPELDAHLPATNPELTVSPAAVVNILYT